MVATTEKAKENGGPQVLQTRPIYCSTARSGVWVTAAPNYAVTGPRKRIRFSRKDRRSGLGLVDQMFWVAATAFPPS